MKILMIANYYYPYISGLSETVKQVSEELVQQGHSVTVLCSNHAKLKEHEVINGVDVYRAPIIAKISKGTVSVKFITWAKKFSKTVDIVHLHLPMLESGLIISKIGGDKCVVTYHCDIDLKKSVLNDFIKSTMLKMNDWALKNSAEILMSSIDYGEHSILAGKYPNKLVEVRTPIKDYHHVEVKKDSNKKMIGFCGRLVMEKGIDVLLKAFKIVKERIPEAELMIGGDYLNIAGGSIYPELKQFVEDEKLKDVHFLGAIPESDMEKFYSSLDVFVLPSVNPLEAFGLVQVEAMYCGTPVVASDLYGVRTVVQNTGMGLIAKKGSPEDFAEKLISVIENREDFVKGREQIANLYSTKWCTNAYVNAYKSVIDKRH